MSASDPRLAAYLRAYALHEALQSEEHLDAAAELPVLLGDAEDAGWPEVAFVAAAGLALYAIVRPHPDVSATAEVASLLHRAELQDAPAFVALALGLRALTAAADGDAAAVLADAGRAVALVDDDRLPPLDRCTAYVIAAAAYNALSLWEIVDELYVRASALLPLCPAPVQEPALAVNRVLIRLEWATALLEVGEDASVQLAGALTAVEEAREVALPGLWRCDVDACETALRLLLGHEPMSLFLQAAAEQSAVLATVGDVEALPILDAARALTLLRRGDAAAAAEVADQLPLPASASSGARSFPAWVRAHVAASPATRSWEEYAGLVARLRWNARGSVLVSARSYLSTERLRLEHHRLSRDVVLDPLTGLQNRRAFDRWLQRPGVDASAALLLVDLDRFKKVNDTYGHATGDEVLRRVGRVIAEHVRPGDLALRHGGDEFAVVLDSALLDAAVVRRRAEELRAALVCAPWDELGPGLSLGASVGVAVGSLRDGGIALYELADDALYRAKTSPGGVVLLEAAG